MHIGWNGVHVEDKKKGDNVHIDKNGVYVNGEKYDREWFIHRHSFPFSLFIIVVYIILGILFGIWHPAWLLFLLIPIRGSFVEAVKCRNAQVFAYPVLVTLIFLCLGFFMGAWHPGWVVFLTIPIYYPLVSYIREL